jgi:hypothetical protein
MPTTIFNTIKNIDFTEITVFIKEYINLEIKYNNISPNYKNIIDIFSISSRCLL